MQNGKVSPNSLVLREYAGLRICLSLYHAEEGLPYGLRKGSGMRAKPEKQEKAGKARRNRVLTSPLLFHTISFQEKRLKNADGTISQCLCKEMLRHGGKSEK